jgi:transposase
LSIMLQVPQIDKIEISPEEWASTPARIQQVIEHLVSENQGLKARLSLIEEQLHQNSQNSSKPPSQDGFGKKASEVKDKSKKKRGGQAGHSGPQPKFYELSAGDEIENHVPKVCGLCGETLTGADESPYRHQILELPSLRPQITEHRLHQLSCGHCGTLTRAKLPDTVGVSRYGERLSAAVALLSSENYQSHSKVQTLLHRLFGIEISVASVNRLRHEMSEATLGVVEQAHRSVQQSPYLHSDETSFTQGNADGKNPERKKGWLWTLVTQSVVVFAVALSRAGEIARTLMGEDYAGILISDRYSGYGWLDESQRQLCWAHIKRDLTAMSERSGVSHEIGAALLRRQKRLFRLWHQVRDGTLNWENFQLKVQILRQGFKKELEQAVQLLDSPQEKSPLAKTLRTCQQLLKWEAALWTFVEHRGVEPTNNPAEQALRSAVIWRRLSFGSQSQAGSQFVARMLTVIASLKRQGRDVLDFLTQACRAARFGDPMPSLLPQVSTP